MPRGRRRNAAQETRLANIINRHIADLVQAIQAEVRGNVADEVQSFLTGAKGVTAARILAKASGKRKRLLPCIAPGCSNPSKGPRFHYLCDKHRDASKKDYEAWRKARHEKQA